MKIIYVGKCNSLSAMVSDRLAKEGHTAFILADNSFTRETSPSLGYKVYRYQGESVGAQKVYHSVRPDTVIFAGDNYEDEAWNYDDKTNRYLAQLLNTLNQASMCGVSKFVYFSSGQVYGSHAGKITEEEPLRPETYKGLLCMQGEKLVTDYCGARKIQTVILRMGDLYGFSANENLRDFVSETARRLRDKDVIQVNSEKAFCPVYLPDAAEAVLRACGTVESVLYNVGGGELCSEYDTACMLREAIGSNCKVLFAKSQESRCPLSSGKIAAELEWVQFYTMEDTVLSHQFNLSWDEEEKRRKREERNRSGLIQTVENIVVFVVFAAVSFVLQNHPSLKTLDVFPIYIILMALLFGVRQSLLSVILSSAYFVVDSAAGTVGITSTLMNVEAILRIAQYIFFGVTVGYSVEQHRNEMQEKANEYAYLSREYEEIKEINEDNVKVKLEYEQRLLSYKTSLPQLYAVVSRISILDKDQIFSAIVDVAKDILGTKTVAVYAANGKSPYIRLIVADGEDTEKSTKSLNLEKMPEMYKAIQDNEVFVGSPWDEGQPAMAAPIYNKGQCIAVIVIRDMPFESLTLYQVNLLRTLAFMITNAVVSAYEYEEATREKKYIPGTDIMVQPEFERFLGIREEERRRGLSESSLLEVSCRGTLEDASTALSSMLRTTDTMGMGADGRLQILLGNTYAGDARFVIDRLRERGMSAKLVQ